MLTTGEWCNPVSNMLHHVLKGLSGNWHERFENVGSVYGRHPGRGYTGGRRSPTLKMRCHGDTLLVALYDTQGNCGRILLPAHRGYYNFHDPTS